jgi:hypothetical protein
MNFRRYWIEFDKSLPYSLLPGGLLLGCGVTARSQADALALVQELIFQGNPVPSIHKIVEDVDISTLDANHVLPNIGMPLTPGIWFPWGY